MDYFKAAFGGFHPQTDPDAAVKFCLQALAADHRLEELAEFMTEGADLGGIEGVPGWLLQRRDDNDRAAGYADWPPGAKFRAFVDPEQFRLAEPEQYYSRTTFQPFVEAIVQTYVSQHRGHTEALRPLLKTAPTLATDAFT